jgi:hypothetical protein
MRRDSAAQSLVRRSRWTTKPFYVAALVALALAAFTFLQANQSPWRQAHDAPWNVHVPEAPVWFALFAASVGWVLLRDHNARTMKPLLGYTSEWVSESVRLVESTRYRRVVLKVSGQGSAVFQRVGWRLGGEQVGTIEELHAALAARDLAEGTDYTIVNFSPFSPLDPGDSVLYFECTHEAAAELADFKALFEFTSMVGDRFRREVNLLPHAGAPSTVAPPAPDGGGPTI